MLSNPTISNILSTLDYVVFALIMVMTIAFVLWGNYRKNKQDIKDKFLDHMLMGRQLTLPMFIATLVATWYGGIFGVSQIAFDNGIFNFVSQGIFWYLTYIIFALFIVSKISRFKALTLPDLIGQMFGPKSEKLSAIFNILNLVPIVYTISLGLLLKMIFGISLPIGIILGVSFVLCYSFIGGFRSVVYSDIFQFFIMVSSVIVVYLLSYFTYGTAIFDTLPASYFEPMGTFTFLETLSWGLIALSTLVDPNFYQRCFAAKDFKIAKKGILISTIVWIIFDLCLTFGAIYARAVIPEANSEFGYFLYALQLLPEGLRGFFLAGICATILSTLDSYIFLAGSTISYDLVPKKFKASIKAQSLGILSVAIFAIILSLIFDGNIKKVWKTLGSISSSALLIPVVFGYISKRKISDNVFLVAASSGAIATILWRLSGFKEYYQLDEIYIGMLSSFIPLLFNHIRNRFIKIDNEI